MDLGCWRGIFGRIGVYSGSVLFQYMGVGVEQFLQYTVSMLGCLERMCGGGRVQNVSWMGMKCYIGAGNGGNGGNWSKSEVKVRWKIFGGVDCTMSGILSTFVAVKPRNLPE